MSDNDELFSDDRETILRRVTSTNCFNTIFLRKRGKLPTCTARKYFVFCDPFQLVLNFELCYVVLQMAVSIVVCFLVK